MKGVARQIDKGGSSVFKIYSTSSQGAHRQTYKHKHNTLETDMNQEH